jgi:hypothetical protein
MTPTRSAMDSASPWSWVTNRCSDVQPLLDPPDLVAELAADLGVQCGQWLVEQQHPGLDRQRPGQRDPLLLAAGDLVRVAARGLGQPDQLQQLQGPRPAAGRRGAADPQAESDVVGHGEVGEQAECLEHHAHAAPVGRVAGDVGPADVHAAGVGHLEAGEHPQGGRLAAAGRAEQRHQFAGAQDEVELVERRDVAEAPGQAAQLDLLPAGRRRSTVDHAGQVDHGSLRLTRRRSANETASRSSQVNSRLATLTATDSWAFSPEIFTSQVGSVSNSRIDETVYSPSTSAMVRNAAPSAALRRLGSSTWNTTAGQLASAR